MNLDFNRIGVPDNCSSCGGKLNYIGVGEYKCEECGNIDYDDYGRVRSYLEKHAGATIGDVSRDTHVPTGRIRQLLENDRIEVSASSRLQLHCPICGEPIRSGKYCSKCEANRIRKEEAEKRNNRVKPDIKVTGKLENRSDGKIHFIDR